MIRLLHENPRFLLLAILLIVISGLAGFSTRPELEDPVTRCRAGFITTEFPGASPSEVEALVSEPIEKALREARGIRSLESSSLRGISLVFVRLTDEVADVDATWATIQDKLSELTGRLPPRAGRPVLVDERRWEAYTTVAALVADPLMPPDPGVLARWAKELDSRLRFVPGTRFTEIFALPGEEILVELSEDSLAASRLTIAEVAQTIRVRDSEAPDATAQTALHAVPVRLMGDIDDLDALRNVLVRSDEQGRQLKLADIATIRRAERTPPTTSAFVNGQRAVVVAARMDVDSDINTWIETQAAVLREFESGLPEGIKLHSLFSQRKYTSQRAYDLYWELIAGMALVVLVTGLMMGWRAAVPICSSMPLAVLIVLFLMIPFGISLHQMSIAGLIIALGVLDSNAIITVDDVERRLSLGTPPLEAIKQCIRHLTIPLVASNLTTILGFAPAYFLPGPTGEFMSQMCWAVNVSLMASVVLSLTLVPILAVWCLRPERAGTTRQLPWKALCSAAYRRLLRACFRRPWVTCLVSLSVPLAGFLVAGRLQEQFFPPADRDHFQIAIRLPSSASLRETAALAEKARQIVVKHPEVAEVSMFVGTNAPMVHYSMLSLDENRSNFAQAIVKLNQRWVNPQLIRDLQRELERGLPEAQFVVSGVEQGTSATAPIEYRIYGPSLEQLTELGDQARRLLMEVPGVVQTRTSLDPGGPQLGVSMLQHEAHGAGLSDQLLAEQLRGQLEGVTLTSMSEQIEELPIRVRLQDADQISPERVLSLPLAGQQAGRSCIVPLGSVADWSVEQQLFSIHRRNSSRCNVVYGYIDAGELPIELENQFKQKLTAAGFELPAGYWADFGGISEERNSAVGHLLEYTAIIVVLMTTALVVTFHSFRLAALIGFVAVLSAGLGFLTLWVFGYPIGLAALVGILGMIGIAINDSIMVLSESQHAWHVRHSVADVEDAVFQATRHIIATTITAGAGVFPLIVGGGDFWPPMAIVITGGVGGATVLALGLTPACFLLMQRKGSQAARPVDQL